MLAAYGLRGATAIGLERPVIAVDVPVHLVGRNLVVALQLELARGLEQHVGPVDVGLNEGIRVHDRPVDVGLGREIDDRVDVDAP